MLPATEYSVSGCFQALSEVGLALTPNHQLIINETVNLAEIEAVAICIDLLIAAGERRAALLLVDMNKKVIDNARHRLDVAKVAMKGGHEA